MFYSRAKGIFSRIQYVSITKRIIKNFKVFTDKSSNFHVHMGYTWMCVCTYVSVPANVEVQFNFLFDLLMYFTLFIFHIVLETGPSLAWSFLNKLDEVAIEFPFWFCLSEGWNYKLLLPCFYCFRMCSEDQAHIFMLCRNQLMTIATQTFFSSMIKMGCNHKGKQ